MLPYYSENMVLVIRSTFDSLVYRLCFFLMIRRPPRSTQGVSSAASDVYRRHVWDSKEDQDSCFFKAVAVAKQILENQIDSANAVNRADEKVQQAYRNSRDGIVVLPCYLPWKNGLYKTDALFVVYPSQRGGWSAQCVTDHKTKRPKLPFPQSWAGQPQEVIEQKSGIPGISFCHASRFLITAKDKETALAACRQVLKNNGRI